MDKKEEEELTCLRWSDRIYVSVRKSSLTFRPSAYALIRHLRHWLLMRTPQGLYFFPGGVIDLGEPISYAVRRGVSEETGLAVEVGKVFTVEEILIQLDIPRRFSNFHCLLMFCEARLADAYGQILPDLSSPADKNEGYPVWLDERELTAERLLPPADKVVRKLQS